MLSEIDQQHTAIQRHIRVVWDIDHCAVPFPLSTPPCHGSTKKDIPEARLPISVDAGQNGVVSTICSPEVLRTFALAFQRTYALVSRTPLYCHFFQCRYYI